MIEFIDNLLEENELAFFKKKMTNNLNDFPIKPTKLFSRYYKETITRLEYNTELVNYYAKIKKYVNFDIFDIHSITLNCVTNDMLDDDKFHKDVCDKTVITYLNSDFEGGNLEYIINDEIKSINPIKNRTIILNSKIEHRVLPVTIGFR
jgi:hypothetical protein